jgi:hypothetical protein
LFNGIKGLLLHPQQRISSLKDWQVNKGLCLEIISKNKSKKACEIWFCLLLLHPAKHAKFVERLVREDKENEDLNLQKNFKFFLRETKEVVFLHSLRETCLPC